LGSEEIQLLKERLHLDKPAPVAYLYWLKNIVQFDLGESRINYKKVSDLIFEKMPISLTFGLSGFFISYLICIPLGIYKALHHAEAFDLATSFLIFFTYSIPIFALALLLLYFFSFRRILFSFSVGA
jgi:microcin C transport system permease protein